MTSQSADEVIARLGMLPIPEEGAWFAAGPRTRGLNGIIALLTDRPDGFSAMHRLTIDEGWQWMAGAPATFLLTRGTPHQLPRKLAYLEGVYVNGAPSNSYRTPP